MGSTNSTPAADTSQRDVVLPPDVLQNIASFLLGVEVLQFSHASPVAHAALNSPEVWNTRIDPGDVSRAPIPSPAWCCPAKAVYCQQRSLHFQGGRRSFSLSRDMPCHDVVHLPDRLLNGMVGYSLELTFSVPPERPGARTCHGGILVGFQDIVCADSTPQKLSRYVRSLALLAVDSNGGLRVNADPAVIEPKAPVAQLTLGRWHHLLVVFDQHLTAVYLDGELCFSHHLARWHRWLSPQCGQLGTGFQPKSFGDRWVVWQPFQGLVARARGLDAVLSEDAARQLTRGKWYVAPEKVRNLLDNHATRGVRRVVASRPCEKYAQLMHTK